MPEWTPRFGSQPGTLTANGIGRQALPMMQPPIASPTFRSRFETTFNPERPFGEVGKMSVNLGAPGVAFGQDASNASGFLQGIGAGVGRLAGGVIGQEKAGADIGEFIGRIGQAPLDLAGNVLGALPPMPGLPGTPIPGMRVLLADEKERERMMADWDGNPMTLLGHLTNVEKQEWLRETERGGSISPLLRDIGPAASLGDQVMSTLGLLGVGSKLVSRTMGNLDGGKDTISRIMDADDDELNDEVKALREDYRNGIIGKDRFLDELVMNNAGYSNNWAVNLLGEMVLDPVLLLGGVTGGVSKAAIGARMVKADKFIAKIGPEAWDDLARRIEQRAVAEGTPLDELTNEMILAEAKRAGIHEDAIAEATAQMSARQRWLAEYAEPLQGVYSVARSINDPISMIGRRGSKPVANAWLTSQATQGVADAYGVANFRHVQGELQALGRRDRWDRAMGYFTAQEGMFMQGDLMAEDVLATRRAGGARPTEHAIAQLRAGGQNYRRQLEAHVGRRKVDLTRPTGLGTVEANTAAARELMATRLSKLAEVSMDDARRILAGVDADGLSMIDAAYFGDRIHRFNRTTRGARERLAAKLASTKATKRDGERLSMLDRTTLMGGRELSKGRAETLRSSLTDLPTAEAAAVGRDAIRRYDRLGTTLIADGPTDEEIVTSLIKWLDDWEDTLTAELTEKQRRLLPQEMLDDLDPEDGYIYGLRPEGEAEWRIKQDPDTGEITSVNPWIDIVGDAAQPWETRFSNDSRVGSMMNALDRAVGAMSHSITTERIFREARQDFMRKGMNGYVPNQTTALTYEQADNLWTAVLQKARDLGTTPRGMSVREFEEVIEKNAAAAASGITARDLMGMTLHSFEGRLSTVGVTQKFTGRAKSLGAELPILPSNMLGTMAERIYPLVRFAYNPFFQLQEWVEPWVFAAARGRQARLTGGWIDPVTGTKVEPDEVMHQQQYLIDRYKAANPYAQFDMMERSLVYLHGSKAAKEATRALDVGRLERARQIALSPKTTADRKAIAQSEMFRYFLGPTLKAQLNSINPRAWAELEMLYKTRDEGTIALRWLTEQDVWAAMDPAYSHHLASAAKARRIGATAPVDLDSTAKHTFKTTRPALTLSVQDGTLTLDDFIAKMDDIGADREFAERSWKALQFDAKTGGVDAFWEQAVRTKTNPLGRSKREVAMARSLAQGLADGAGITEVELLSRMLNGHILTIMQDDLLMGLETDFAGWDALFQQAKYAESNWFTRNPVTGAVDHAPLDPVEAEARFLAQAKDPPSDLPVEQHGAYDRMEKVQFGSGGRTLFIPGGEAALRDIETPFTVWEAHLIRNQLVDPNELLDPTLKHALYEKMWRGHTIDMADPANQFKVYNNTVMAMLSAGLNLTRNELISTRLRVNSMEELHGLAADVAAIRRTIGETLEQGEGAGAGDLGLAYSTRQDVAHYVPLDAVDEYARTAMRPEAEAGVRQRAAMASGYLQSGRRTAHDAIRKAREDAGMSEVGRISEWATDQAAEAIMREGIAGIRTLDNAFKPPRGLITGDVKAHTKYLDAAAKLAEDPTDLAARDVIRELVPGAASLDEAIVWKPWNINGAGAPPLRAPDGKVTGHGDHPIYAYLKNDDVKWRGFSTNVNIGRALAMAEDMAANPQHYVRREGEALADFAERVSHRNSGLSLKTGYFGIDLGDPMGFERGVMDTHMVGDLTEWLYHDVTQKGTVGTRWQDFVASLSPKMRKQIEEWLDRRVIDVPEMVDGKATGKKVEVPWPDGAPRGAGVFGWNEAAGQPLSFKPAASVVPDETVAGRSAFVRDRIAKSKALTDEEKARLHRLYPTDEDLAELYGRDIKVFAGDYRIYDDLMAERKAIETAADPNVGRYGHGGYQWKLWDDRRKVYDPETSAFAGMHGVKRRAVRHLAASDEMHFASGFMDTGGLRPVSEAGYRFLDPTPTIMTQQQGHLLRGATISTDGTERIIAITENANPSTFVHELAHALLEPLLDPSGKNVVLDDINELIRAANEATSAGIDVAQAEVTRLADEVATVEGAFIDAQKAAKTAAGDAKTKVAAAEKAERAAKALATRTAEQRGKVKALSDDLKSKRKAIEGQKMAPSIKARRLAAVDSELAREVKKLDTLNHQRLDAEASVSPLWDEANAAQDLATTSADEAKALAQQTRDLKKAGAAAKTEYDRLATSTPKDEKLVWDEEVSEHLAEQYEVWLRTGKAKNPKMRDAMAYFHRVLQRLEAWLKRNPQVKVSKPMQDLFDRMHSAKVQEQVVQSNPVAFDATQEAMHQAGRQSVMDAEDAAFTNVQFRRGRSWAERSLNHPYFGLYPFSYMWGKVTPEMVRSLATNPFGFPIPGMLEGSTPLQGFTNAQRVWNAVEMQKDQDEEFNKFMNDPMNDKMFRAAAMFMPATPWDAPANFPLWSRRLSEWGLESQKREEEGKQPKGFDIFSTASDVAGYAFGPAASLDWFSDIARIPKAPAISQFTEGEEEGVAGMSANDLVVTPEGLKPLSETLAGASGQLQQELSP